MVAAVPRALCTLHVYTPRSSVVTTRMVRRWKFFSVEEMRRRLLLSRMTPSALGQSKPGGQLKTPSPTPYLGAVSLCKLIAMKSRNTPCCPATLPPPP